MWSTFIDPELTIMQGMVDQYNGQASGHQVKLVQIPPAEVTDVTKLMTAVRGGTGPDVYHLDRFIVAQRAADGLLQDLGEFGADLSDLPSLRPGRGDVRWPALRAAVRYRRPRHLLQQGDAAAGRRRPGRARPEQRPADLGPRRRDRQPAESKDSTGNYSQMGFVPWVNQGWHYTYGFSWGGQFFNVETCQVTPGRSEHRRGVRMGPGLLRRARRIGG